MNPYIVPEAILPDKTADCLRYFATLMAEFLVLQKKPSKSVRGNAAELMKCHASLVKHILPLILLANLEKPIVEAHKRSQNHNTS